MQLFEAVATAYCVHQTSALSLNRVAAKGLQTSVLNSSVNWKTDETRWNETTVLEVPEVTHKGRRTERLRMLLVTSIFIVIAESAKLH